MSRMACCMRYEVWGMRHDEDCLFCFSRPRMTWLRVTVCVVPLRLWNRFGSPDINSIGQWIGLPYSMIQYRTIWHVLSSSSCLFYFYWFVQVGILDALKITKHTRICDIFELFFGWSKKLKNEESKSSYFNKHQRGQRQQASWTAELLNCWTSIILIYHMICTLGTITKLLYIFSLL